MDASSQTCNHKLQTRVIYFCRISNAICVFSVQAWISCSNRVSELHLLYYNIVFTPSKKINMSIFHYYPVFTCMFLGQTTDCKLGAINCLKRFRCFRSYGLYSIYTTSIKIKKTCCKFTIFTKQRTGICLRISYQNQNIKN